MSGDEDPYLMRPQPECTHALVEEEAAAIVEFESRKRDFLDERTVVWVADLLRSLASRRRAMHLSLEGDLDASHRYHKSPRPSWPMTAEDREIFSKAFIQGGRHAE